MKKFTLAPWRVAADMAERQFFNLRSQILLALPKEVEIEHIGATSIAGCLTKGDLDIVIRVTPETFLIVDSVLATLFKRNLKSVRTDHFSAFEDTTTQPPVGVQLVVYGTPLDVFVHFRDLLRDSPQLVEQYNALKRRFDGADMSAYRVAKSAFIESVLQKPLMPSNGKKSL